MSSLTRLIKQHDLKIVCVTESHLTSSISDSVISISHFHLFRKDVSIGVEKHGVCIYVHEAFMVDRVTDITDNALMFRLPSFNVHFLCVYRPPSNSETQNNVLAACIQNSIQNKEVIILGDLNLPGIQWSHTGCLPVGCFPPLQTKFLDVFESEGLLQWVAEPTFPRSGNTLDLILTSENDRIGNVFVEPPMPACDHCPVIFDYVFSGKELELESRVMQHKLSWHKGNYKRLNEELREIDWEFELKYLDASDSFDRFKDILTTQVLNHVPTLSKKADYKQPWPKNPPRGLLSRRHEAWIAYKRARSLCGRSSTMARDAFSDFSAVNRQVRNFEVMSQASYEHSMIERFGECPKLLHSYIRSKKVAPPTVGPIRLGTGQLSSDPLVMSETLASAFAAVYVKETPAFQEPHQTFDGTIESIQVTAEDVLSHLQALDANSAMGPDFIHPLVLKNCSEVLSHPLNVIFCRSLAEGVVPSAWKRSTVVPLFKKGARYDPLNYRPVSLTSVCCKTMERIITKQLYEYLESNGIISDHQFGFRPGRSVMEQLLLVYEDISYNMDSGQSVDLVLFDYSKAFDVVCHSILIQKLKLLGVDGQLLSWISSFLSDRVMQVCVHGHTSSTRNVCSGVPQGSVLGPLLFLVYINFVGSKLSCTYKIFADDMKLFASVVRNPVSLHPSTDFSLQHDIDVLFKTSLSWGLHMNKAKCAVLRFSRRFRDQSQPLYMLDGTQLPVHHSQRDLGVLVDDSLKFHEHIATVTHRASGLCHNFRKSTVCRSVAFMMFLLKTHIRPVLEYASCLWCTEYADDIRKLERVQRRWTKQIEGFQEMSYAERLKELDLYSVQGRFIRADLIQYWKIFHGKSTITPEDIFHQPLRHGTRGHCFKLYVSRAVCNVRQRSFSQRRVAIWNSLPEAVVTASELSTFKRLLAQALGNMLYDYI